MTPNKFNYKNPKGALLLEIGEINNSLKTLENLLEKNIFSYLNKEIINLDFELISKLISDNYYYDHVKVYDKILIDLINKKPELISEEIVKLTINNQNFYPLLHILEHKYILSNDDIKLIFEKGMCVDELFDIIFGQYLEKNKENFIKWFKYHRYNTNYYDYIPQFMLIIDDSYLDIFLDNDDSGNLLLDETFYKMIENQTKISPKKIEFYESFRKNTSHYKMTEDKIEKLLVKYKKQKVTIDKFCIYNLLRGYYDELAEKCIDQYKIDVKPEKMILLANSYSTKKKYLEILMKNSGKN